MTESTVHVPDHIHPDIDGDLAERRNVPTLEHLKDRGPGRHGYSWLPPIDPSERANLHARLHDVIAPPQLARLDSILEPGAALEVYRALAQYPYLGHLMLQTDRDVTLADVVAELRRIGEILRREGEHHTETEEEIGRFCTDLAGFRRILGISPAEQVTHCSWCGGEPLVRHHFGGQAEHRP